MVPQDIIKFLTDIIEAALLSGGEGTWRGVKIAGVLIMCLGIIDLVTVYFWGINIFPGFKSETEGYIVTAVMVVIGLLVFMVGKIGNIKQQRRKSNR